MRIRKRQVPFSLSSLSPVPLSDPLPPVVQLHPLPILPEDDDTAEYFNAPSSSDHQIQPIQAHKKDEEESNDYTRSNLLGAKTDQGRMYEGEKLAVPLKKRRGKSNEEEQPNKKMKTKKCVEENDKDYEEGEEEEEEEKKSSVKKRGRGGALMEGSRCSRVNGRGWRCCQQTLVGYSLCEHHLGKGRLRSMNSVRSRSMATSTSTSASSNNHSEDGIMSKRKNKLGIVKARSMSSLLGQQNNVIALSQTKN
ncbi:uncharacterized protein [Euphorbia lathyris]|uniref:uncharacterized protein isoform X2 n=1 Tax=Euphorbia lathyris TaxID=212925 RepID=UPI003313397D